MNGQFDLFAGSASRDQAPVEAGHPARWTHWKHPMLTPREMRLMLARARRNLHTVPEPIRAAFGLAVNTYRNGFKDWFPHSISASSDKTFHWSMIRPKITRIKLNQLVRCETADLPGVEIKRHQQYFMTWTAIHVPGVGTLELMHWAIGNLVNTLYAPFRTNGLLHHYHDDCPRIALPRALWETACCAQKLGESGEKIVDVPTISYGGRDHVVTNTVSGAGRWGADAWSIAPQDTWNGPAYTNNQLRRAWDVGEIERGNNCGQLVRVRGQVCVLQAPSFFHDESAVRSKTPASAGVLEIV